MTTIAFDGKSFAADTCCTGQYTLQEPFLKLWGVGDFWIAGAGTVHAITRWIDWFTTDGSDYPYSSSEDSLFEAMMVVNKKTFTLDVYEFASSLPVLTGVTSPYAAGSGGDFAMGAMLAGKTAVEAIRIAAKLDPLTNDDIHAVHRRRVRAKGAVKK